MPYLVVTVFDDGQTNRIGELIWSEFHVSQWLAASLGVWQTGERLAAVFSQAAESVALACCSCCRLIVVFEARVAELMKTRKSLILL